MSNEIQKTSKAVATIRKYLNNEGVQKRLSETLGKRAGAFANSIINVVRNNSQLQNCVPDSVMSSAMIAATLNLAIDPALGQAAIVAYKNQAQFQIMYRGIIQLCLRSGQYATIHCSEVYQDELKSFNPITGEVTFKNPETYKLRNEGKVEDVIGHYAYFKLNTGFEKSDYMTHIEVLSHAERYSRAYQYDIREKKKVSPWSVYPVQMGNKTVLLRLLKKYGVMSIEMQEAIVADYEPFEQAQENAQTNAETMAGSEAVEAEFVVDGQKQQAKQKRRRKKKVESGQKTEEPPKQETKEIIYVCERGHEFTKERAEAKYGLDKCPDCLNQNIKIKED